MMNAKQYDAYLDAVDLVCDNCTLPERGYIGGKCVGCAVETSSYEIAERHENGYKLDKEATDDAKE